jgi:hypothetical protein
MAHRFGLCLVLLGIVQGCSDTSTRSSAEPVRPDASDGSAAGTVDIAMQPFTVPPGGEAYKCQNFTNPFGNAPVDVDRFEARMPAGSHHMIVFFVDGVTDGPLEDCSGSEFHPNVFGAQVAGDSVIDLPRGIGVAIPPSSGLRYQLHFVNTTGSEAVASVTTKYHVAAPGSITEHAGQLLFSNEDITIPPGVPTQVTKTCSVPQDLSILGVSAHVHTHAVDFVATTGGTELYETKGWSDPVPKRFDPPFPLPANQAVTFTCSYVNDTAQTITFGESAVTNEMCILGAIYYPVADVTSPNVVCF